MNNLKTLTPKFNEFIDVDPKNVVSQVSQIWKMCSIQN